MFCLPLLPIMAANKGKRIGAKVTEGYLNIFR